MKQIMLTREMRGAISLLKEINYMQGYAVCAQSLSEPFRMEACRLLNSLCHVGLLRVVESSDEDQLCFRYALCRSLQEITLYDVLCATDGFLHLSVNGSAAFTNHYSPANYRLSVLESMIYHFLSEIHIVELVLPDRVLIEDMTEKGNLNETDTIKGREWVE